MADTRLPNLHFGTEVTGVKAGLVWTAEDGLTHGGLDLTQYSDIVFHSPQQVRDMMAVLSDLASAMDTEVARAAAEKENPGA